jgi:hypothetical protein
MKRHAPLRRRVQSIVDSKYKFQNASTDAVSKWKKLKVEEVEK